MFGRAEKPLLVLCAIATGGLLATTPLHAQDGESLFGVDSASVTYGPYLRLDLGGAMLDPSSATWAPPSEDDPSIALDASADDVGFGAIGVGFDWQNGIRADLSVFGMGKSDMTAPCSSASDGSSCSTHGSVSDASITTRGVMASVYYAPLEARGSNARFQPFFVAGIGGARNEVGDWTRENPGADRPVRTFEGDTTSGLAWSVGVGASYQVTEPGRWPVIVEASWRYYDFGNATGSSTPLPESGSSEPRDPFNFDNEAQVVTFGVRIPLQRY